MNCFSFHLSCCVGLMYINIMNHSRYCVNRAIPLSMFRNRTVHVQEYGFGHQARRYATPEGSWGYQEYIIPPYRRETRTAAGPDGHMVRHILWQGRKAGRITAGLAGVPPRPIRRPCATQYAGRNVWGIPCRTDRSEKPPGHKGRHTTPVQGTLKSGRAGNAGCRPYPHTTAPPPAYRRAATPPEPKGGAGRRAANARTPAICGTHHKQTAVCRSCGVVDNTPRLAAWCGDFAHISCRRPGNG